MDTKHTPEPFIAEGCLISSESDGLIGSTHYAAMDDATMKANAARIVSCVNNCAGINPAAVPGLVAALDRVALLNEHAGEIGSGMLMTIVTEARAALAAAKGEAC